MLRSMHASTNGHSIIATPLYTNCNYTKHVCSYSIIETILLMHLLCCKTVAFVAQLACLCHHVHDQRLR
jgi:hypothetical protein